MLPTDSWAAPPRQGDVVIESERQAGIAKTGDSGRTTRRGLTTTAVTRRPGRASEHRMRNSVLTRRVNTEFRILFSARGGGVRCRAGVRDVIVH